MARSEIQSITIHQKIFQIIITDEIVEKTTRQYNKENRNRTVYDDLRKEIQRKFVSIAILLIHERAAKRFRQAPIFRFKI
ncbi:CLUMA_CG001834, isoform A [Clunio marinus]|uniref:CLUMA_CG001834, isoform A n=1 Tax=Clunio marinus TaxID=568069 RepID=A0A1J1HPB1_9DIPT|nr:CLUMA_CG001834, isoform A [Clunio marinus]